MNKIIGIFFSIREFGHSGKRIRDINCKSFVKTLEMRSELRSTVNGNVLLFHGGFRKLPTRNVHNNVGSRFPNNVGSCWQQ